MVNITKEPPAGHPYDVLDGTICFRCIDCLEFVEWEEYHRESLENLSCCWECANNTTFYIQQQLKNNK